MAVNTYQPGDEVSITFTVRDSTSTLYDPASVKFHYTDSAGTDYTKIYGTDTDVVSKTSTGIYKLVIYIPYATVSIGNWHYDAQALDGSNNSLLVEDGVFIVKQINTLPPPRKR